MLKQDLILRNPLRLMGNEDRVILPEGHFGAVLARAGVGKTALMVQLALESLLKARKVLHVGLNAPVEKVTLWYKEVFFNLADKDRQPQMHQLWESILPLRFIMTFKVEGFSVPKLEERLSDLTEQRIFSPDVVIFDGFPFDEDAVTALPELKRYARQQGLAAWFSVRTHRHEAADAEGIPPQLNGIDDLFDLILALQPDGDKIHIKAMRGAEAPKMTLLLDPATMLIKNDRSRE